MQKHMGTPILFRQKKPKQNLKTPQEGKAEMKRCENKDNLSLHFVFCFQLLSLMKTGSRKAALCGMTSTSKIVTKQPETRW